MTKLLKKIALAVVILMPVTILKVLAEKHFGWDLDYAYGWLTAMTWTTVYFWKDFRR